MQYQNDTGDLSVRGPEDLFTEAGQIGYHYNILMNSLEKSDKIMRKQWWSIEWKFKHYTYVMLKKCDILVRS